MNSDNTFNFTTTPALIDACKQYYTNVANMWSSDSFKQDLKVVVLLLLRTNLAKKRFFGLKKYRKTEKSKREPKAQK